MAFFESVKRTAILSPCKQYRYWLSRTWEADKPLLVFIGLNPSKADAELDDATVRWLTGYARSEHGGIGIINLFGWRATSPADMMAAKHPIQAPGSTDNDIALYTAITNARRSTIICGWGTNGTFLSRDRVVLRMLARLSVQPYALAFNKDGTPHHPLRLSHKSKLKPMELESV